MAARFQIRVERRPPRVFSRFFQSERFGVLDPGIPMDAATDDAPIFDDEGADHGIGADFASGRGRQLQGQADVVFIRRS